MAQQKGMMKKKKQTKNNTYKGEGGLRQATVARGGHLWSMAVGEEVKGVG